MSDDPQTAAINKSHTLPQYIRAWSEREAWKCCLDETWMGYSIESRVLEGGATQHS
jgi:hypothetical protein